MQHLAGLHTAADYVAQIIQSRLSAGAELFLSLARLIVFAACDAFGRCWVVARTGPPGFVRAAPDMVHIIGGLPRAGALTQLAPGDLMGFLAIDMSRRRRLRFNGRILEANSNGVTIQVMQAYSNCPKYIDPTAYDPAQQPNASTSSVTGRNLTKTQCELISGARFFFIGSLHPEHGADASHRGGHPGFVTVHNTQTLTFPDYHGNAMFNTLGNLLVNPTVGILFLNSSGGQLQLTGGAEIRTHTPTPSSPEGRTITVHIEKTVYITPPAGASPDSH